MKNLKALLILYTLTAAFSVFYVYDIANDEDSAQLSLFLPDAPVSLLPDGTLIRSAQDEKVYYIENSQKRWIESAEAFRIQGFKAEDVRIVTAYEISQYTIGENLTVRSNITMPNEMAVLPDLAPLAIRDLRFSTVGGRKVLRFSGLFWNQGKRNFRLISNPNSTANLAEGYTEVIQPITREDGTSRSKMVGTFYWHAPHNHYHHSDFAEYVFASIKPSGDAIPITPSLRQKVTFCLRDNDLISTDLPGAKATRTFSGTCGRDDQGVSIGWADLYKYDLPDQYIDVQDMPAGIYSLSFFLDPNQRFVEERKDNNISIVVLYLDPAANIVRVIASAAPFKTSLNTFTNGTILRAGGKGEIYIIHNNKKRWLKSADLFNSYNYDWDAIYTMTESIIDAIPLNNLVRIKGHEEVYALNDLGYKRHILNAEVFSSYRFTAADVADINEAEFAVYPDSKLIRVFGDGDIYLINGSTKKKLGKLDYIQTLGYELESIHTVNQADFNTYSTLP